MTGKRSGYYEHSDPITNKHVWTNVGDVGLTPASNNIQPSLICWAALGCNPVQPPSDRYPMPPPPPAIVGESSIPAVVFILGGVGLALLLAVTAKCLPASPTHPLTYLPTVLRPCAPARRIESNRLGLPYTIYCHTQHHTQYTMAAQL